MIQLISLLVVCCISLSLQAQTVPSRGFLRGQLRVPNSLAHRKVVLKFLPAVRTLPCIQTSLAGGGRFELDGVAAGSYELVVATPDGQPIERRSVEVQSDQSLDIDLRMPPPSRRSDVIPAGRLGRHVPKSAIREFTRALEAWRKGDLLESESRFSKAVALAPTFTEALNNLGVLYMRRNDTTHAGPLIRAALESDPHLAEAYINAAALATMDQRLDEAARLARKAIDLDPASMAARFLLGRTLATQQREFAEALFQLRRSAPEYPNALLHIAEILYQLGKNTEAAEELRSYLASPDPEYPEVARSILSIVEQSLRTR